jgi:hypothetical protein
MNPYIIKAVAVVSCALIFYSIAVITEQKKKSVPHRVLIFLILGVLFDISSTVLMIKGSQHIITWHGAIGYSALLVMLIDTILIWRFRIQEGHGIIPHRLHLYTRIAYVLWCMAYVAGAVMSAFSV